MVVRAADIHTGNPAITGLPLLREAMLTLAVSRRRPLRSLKREPWFMRGVSAEINTRSCTDAPMKQLVCVNAQILDELRRQSDILLKLFGNGPPTVDRRA